MAVTAEFEANWLEMQNKYGAGIDSGEVPLLAAGDIDASVTIPAAKFTAPYVPGGTNIFQDFRHVPMTTFVLAVQAQADAIKAAWEQWFGTGDTSGIQKIWKDWYTQTQDDWTTWFGTDPTATSEGSGVKKEWAGLKTNAQSATNDANTAAATANAAAGRVETAISGANSAASAANQAAQRADTSRQEIEANESTRQQNESTRQQNESTRQSQETTRQNNEQSRTTTFNNDHQTATSDHNQASQNHNRAETDHQTASDDHTQATADHNASVTATNEASNVDADLTGMTVTIINRNGVAKTVDLSFDFYASYPSVAAMNADAANIPKCSLVSIATTNKTDPENARIYQKRSDGTMIYVGDLDQASAEAWADWLENKKPEIDARIATADNDHTRAESDHSTATDDHSQAGDDHQTATSDHNRAEQDHQTSVTDSAYAEDQGDYAKNMADHPGYIADGTAEHPGSAGYYYTWDYDTQQYVRGALLSLDWDTMTEEQKAALAADVLAAIGFDDMPTQNSDKAVKSGGLFIALGGRSQLIFASNQTCEDIIDELT